MEVWRNAYLNLGKENTKEDKKDFDEEFKSKIERKLKTITQIEKENKEQQTQGSMKVIKGKKITQH